MKKMLLILGLASSCFLQSYGQTVKASDSSKASPALAVLKAVPDSSVRAMEPKKDATVLLKKFRKSARKAFFLSLLVPGAGEYYVGNKNYTKGFLTAETVIWSAALFSKYQGDMWRRDYISYAAQQAGSNSSRTDDFYYQNMYEWPNSYWYNEDQWRQARDLYPYDPAAQQAYVADKLYSPEDAWDWQDYGQWEKYRSLRVKSRNALHRISYSVGAAVFNHMLSAINAARVAKRYNKQKAKLSQITDWRLECYSCRPETVTLSLWRSF
jgi:hypothetical protein